MMIGFDTDCDHPLYQPWAEQYDREQYEADQEAETLTDFGVAVMAEFARTQSHPRRAGEAPEIIRLGGLTAAELVYVQLALSNAVSDCCRARVLGCAPDDIRLGSVVCPAMYELGDENG